MQRIFGLPTARLFVKRPILTLGMFDGVHLGHQAVLREVRDWARSHGAPAVVLTFDTHPRAVLPGSTPPLMITSLEHRLTLFATYGMEAAVVLPFNQEVFGMSAERFAEEILGQRLAAQGVVLGFDARFGSDRGGDAGFLAARSAQLDFATRLVSATKIEGEIVSSTAIRQAVLTAKLERATEMLGRPPSSLGTVVRGLGLGRHLGFPTLNMDSHHELHPPCGVYLTRTRCGNTLWPSVTNVGHRPTVDATTPQDVLIETHLLGPGADLYGQTVEVSYLKHLRAERRFSDLDSLKSQIASDVAAALEAHGLPERPLP